MSSEELEIERKKWTTVGTYTSFEEADIKRNELKSLYDSVKIKRGGKGGNIFRIKAWNPPPPESKKNKRSKNKNDNKKIRNRSKQS